jgi:AraC-like DNA-binding protein
MKFENLGYASFHYIRRGRCQIKMGDIVHELSSGDLLFIGRGDDHTLYNATPGGPGNPITILLCGYFHFDETTLSPLMLTALPHLLILDQDKIESRPWLKSTLEHISTEFQQLPPGADLVVDKLTEVLLVELIRCQLDSTTVSSLVASVFDSRIAPALELMHTEPEKPWSLKTLAEEVAMSRSAFANLFRKTVGQTMFQYLTEIRLRKSKQLLARTDYPIDRVAELVGYGSGLAFARMFKTMTGISPGRYRKGD